MNARNFPYHIGINESKLLMSMCAIDSPVNFRRCIKCIHPVSLTHYTHNNFGARKSVNDTAVKLAE